MVDIESTINTNGGMIYANMAVHSAMTTTITGSSGFISTAIEALIPTTSAFTAGMTVYPIFEIRNLDDVLVDTVDYESIYAGHQTATQHLKFINHTASQLDVTLTPKASLTPIGTAIDTYQSQYLSLDDTTYSNVLLLEIPAHDSLDCYLKYQPSSKAKVGEKQWEVSQRDSGLIGADLLPSWFFALPINVVGAATETTDARVLVTLDYVAGQMQTDFRDLRFCLADGTELEYEQAYLIEGVECTFIVTIPILPASPSSTDFYVYSGNGLAISNATDAGLEEYNWLDGTTDPWTLEWGSGSGVETGTIFGASHSYYRLQAWWSSYNGWLSKPETTAYGVWEYKFKWGAMNHAEMGLAFITDGSAWNSPGYEIVYGYPHGTGFLQLRYNGTAIATTSITVDTEIHTLNVVRTQNGTFKIYLDDSLLINYTHNTLTESQETWLKYWAAESNPENRQVVYFDYVNITPADVTGTITIGDWTFYAVLNCNAGILYKSQDLPELEAEISYGCRIGGDYYE